MWIIDLEIFQVVEYRDGHWSHWPSLVQDRSDMSNTKICSSFWFDVYSCKREITGGDTAVQWWKIPSSWLEASA